MMTTPLPSSGHATPHSGVAIEALGSPPPNRATNGGTRTLEWLGAAFGLLGSAILAARLPWSGAGFIAFMVSNVAIGLFAIRTKSWGLFAMQIGFTGTSAIGIYRWLA